MRGSVSIVVVACCLGTIVYASRASWAQETMDSGRKVVHKVAPSYPELARKMNITGSVKLEVTVGANGMPKSPKVVGGHPLLVQAAIDAVNAWRWSPGQETKELVEFKFSPE